jgi:hypothetical protein
MKHLPIKLSLTALSLVLCSGAWAQQVLQPTDKMLKPDELCSDYPDSANKDKSAT